MAPIRYYHVLNKSGEWRLYFGNAPAPIMSDTDRTTVVKAARALARQSGMKVIIHKESAPGETSDHDASRGDSRSDDN